MLWAACHGTENYHFPSLASVHFLHWLLTAIHKPVLVSFILALHAAKSILVKWSLESYYFSNEIQAPYGAKAVPYIGQHLIIWKTHNPTISCR